MDRMNRKQKLTPPVNDDARHHNLETGNAAADGYTVLDRRDVNDPYSSGRPGLTERDWDSGAYYDD